MAQRRFPAALRLADSAPAMLVLAVLGWSGNFVVGRLVGASMPPVALAWWRWVIAGALLTPFGWRRVRAQWPLVRARLGTVLMLSFTGVTLFNTLVYKGLQTTTVVNGVLLQSVIPVLLVVVAFALWGQRPHAGELAGLALSLLGVWIVVTGGNPWAPGALRLGGGDLLILLAVLAYTVYTAMLTRRPPVHPVTLLIVTFGFGAAMLTPAYAIELAGGARIPATAGSAWALAYVGLVPSVMSYFCWNRGVELAGPVRAGQFIHLMPVAGAGLSWLVLGEGLRPYHLLAGTFIGAGIVWSGRSRRGRPRQRG